MAEITIDITVRDPYRVHIGTRLLEAAGSIVREAVPRARKAAIVTDSNAGPLYAHIVRESLAADGFDTAMHVFPAGEEHKTLATYGQILDFLATEELDRSDVVIALGGGVTGDMAGFAAATYMRGIAYVQMPTTLLAMVDSSVGGKCAVDLSCGKNLAGAFWQPAAVIADVGCLGTLTPEQLADGCGEVVKHAAIADHNLFEVLEKTPLTFDLLTSDLGRAAAIIARNVEIKRDVVVSDERETGIRKLLNFGHSIGHAIEACSRYTIGHGTCVAQGMVAMARGARRAGWNAHDLEDDVAERIDALCRAHGLATACPFGADELFEAALHDKKRRGTTIDLVIPHSIGAASIERCDLEQLRAIIELGVPAGEASGTAAVAECAGDGAVQNGGAA